MLKKPLINSKNIYNTVKTDIRIYALVLGPKKQANSGKDTLQLYKKKKIFTTSLKTSSK